jgi:hypothetical protein
MFSASKEARMIRIASIIAITNIKKAPTCELTFDLAAAVVYLFIQPKNMINLRPAIR